MRTIHLWLPSRGDTLHFYLIQDTNCSADDFARPMQNQEKEKTPTTELNIFLPKIFFRRKIKTGMIWTTKLVKI